MDKLSVGAVLSHKEGGSPAPRPVYWVSHVRPVDDWDDPITTEFIDGRTKYGPWAIMTPNNHMVHGVGTGTGKGQRYRKQDDGRWLKVEG